MTAAQSVSAIASAPGQPLVEMRNIHVSFGGVRAVNDVSVDLHPGEVVGLVGGNGAGKSTLIRMLVTLLPPTSGTAVINGFEVHVPSDKYELRVSLDGKVVH